MKVVKAISLIVALLTVGTLIFSSCAPTPSAEETAAATETAAETKAEETKAPAEKITITMWSHWINEKVKVDYFEEAAKAYEAANPNIDMEITWYDWGPLDQALRAAFAANIGTPDIFYLSPWPYPDFGGTEFVNAGYAADLTPYITKENIIPGYLDTVTYNGKIMVFPVEGGTTAIYLNKALFDKAGVTIPGEDKNFQFTWDEWIDAIKKFKSADITPIASGASANGFDAGILPSVYCAQALGKDKWIELLKDKIPWDDPTVLRALTLTKESLVDLKAFNSDLLSLTYPEGFSVFSRGDAAMEVDGPWALSRGAQPPGEGGFAEGFQLDVMGFPVIPDSLLPKFVPQITGGAYSVNSKSQHVAEAAKFLEFINNTEWAKKWAEIVHGQACMKGGSASELSDLTLAKLQMIMEKGEVVNPGYFCYGLSGDSYTVVDQTLQSSFLVGMISLDDMVKKINEVIAVKQE